MKSSLNTTEIQKGRKACLMLGVFEDGSLSPTAKEVDRLSQGRLSQLMKQGAFQAKIGQYLPLYGVLGNADPLFLVGCGKLEGLKAPLYRKIIAGAFKALTLSKIAEVNCCLAELSVENQSWAWKVKQIIEAAYDGIYRFDSLKSERETIYLEHLSIQVPAKELKACERALKQGQAIAEAVSFTKNLANLPSNICTPTYLADQAKQLAKSVPALSVKILEEKDMQKLGMGALLGVAQGSKEDAKLICLEYRGNEKSEKKAAPIALVGKGVTFDTGGISLKPADSMVGMKYDMCGAATVLGTIKAAAQLKLPINIVGVIPAVENMPGGGAYKPEDILTSMSGQTIEVISTDAEGRLILADALTYCERFKPEYVIDIATLTGAVVIALGFHATGLLSNSEDLAKALLKAGIESNDRAWQLPLWDEYQEQIKSPFADMANTGGRSGGTITAACFLSRFTKKFKWAHLDVAGTAAMMIGNQERMANGRPVPLLVQFLIDEAKQ